MARTPAIPATVDRLCRSVYDAAKEKDQIKVHYLNIRLVQYRAKPEFRERAERTTENLRNQIAEMSLT